MTALDVAKAIADLLVTRVDEYSDRATEDAKVLSRDPDHWSMPEMTTRITATLWRELQVGLVAEIGAPLVLDGDRAGPSDNFDGRVVTADPDDFEDDPNQAPYGWTALARVHKREAGWDFAPDFESGHWLGWWEPEAFWNTDHGRGMLTGFVIVKDGALIFAHVVKSRRRQGIGSKLVAYAQAHHGVSRAEGPFTDDGQAFSAAMFTRPDDPAPGSAP